jgi:type IV pilus assembly protein PilQ
MYLKNLITIALVISLVTIARGQDRFAAIANTLESLSMENAGLNESVELSVNGASIQEFIRGIGLTHGLNLSVDASVNDKVVNNFSNARVADVLLFLCKEYDLEINVVGSIISFRKYNAPRQEPKPVAPKILSIEYFPEGDLLSIDLKNDSLEAIAREITRRSGKNLIISPESGGKNLSIYLQKVPFENAVDKIAFAAGLVARKTDDGIYVIEKAETVAQSPDGRGGNFNRGKGGRSRGLSGNGDIQLEIKDGQRLSVAAQNVPVADLLENVSKEMGVNYMLYSVPKGDASLFLEDITYPEFLNHLLNGSTMTYKVQDSIYLIGERNIEGLRISELVRLENRTLKDVLPTIPPELKKDVEIFEFKELNGLVMSGSRPRIEELKAFLRQIDQVVPLIMIEIIIVDVKNGRETKTGLSMGLGGDKANRGTGGTIAPNIDFNFSSRSINKILSSFNGFGVLNLGRVTPDFYLNLQLLETEGLLKKRSTPKLSTLNGNEATLSIGNTEYYLELQNNLIGTQNPVSNTTQNYKSVNADLFVKIEPVVSGDDQVTLSIEVTQSDFTARISPTAPPGSETKKFKSIIRVKNQEMILLGGLEINRNDKTGSGVPFINRIPVLKYIFGQRATKTEKNKLNLFIRPTIFYS